jgi:t-SNARE complex subunit (syntaxin)
MADEKLSIRITAMDKTRDAFRSVAGGLNRVKKSVFSVKGAVTGLAGALALKKFTGDIDDLAKQSARLGITVNQLQTLQFAASQSGTGAEELKKGFERFTKSISEASTGVGTGIRAFDALGITLTNNDGTLKTSNDLLNEVANGFTQIENPADRVRIAMDLFGRAGAGMVNMLQSGSGSLQALRDQFNLVTIELTGEQAKAVEEANDRFDKLFRVFGSIGQQITATLMPALASIGTVVTSVVLLSISKTIGALRALANTGVDIINFFKENDLDQFTFGENFQKDIERIRENLNAVVEPVDALSNSVNNVADGFVRQQTAVEKANKSFKDYAEASKEVEANLKNAAFKGLQSLEDGLVGIMTGTMKAKDAFRSMAQSIIADLARIFIQKQITGAIAGAFGGFFGGKAIGGAVQRGQPYMVGERGKELFVPNQSGTIIPSDKLGGGGSGVVVNQTINLSTGVQQTVRTEIASLMPQIAEATKSAVAEARMRGGSFSKALGN